MKKTVISFWALLCTAIAFACSGSEPAVDGVTGATEQNGSEDGSSASGKKSLLVYFSRAGENWQVGVVERGNTAVMVDYIKEVADVDVFEIVPEVAYPENYTECTEYVTEEINRNDRPKYKGDVTNIADYDNVFIGGPIWWGRPPMLFRTFFEAHPELDGKTIIPFGTHGGSGISSYPSLIREYFPNANVLEALGINGASIRDESSRTMVANWIDRLGLRKSEQAKTYKVKITFEKNGTPQMLTATFDDNATSRALVEMMPMTLPMLDLYEDEMCYRFTGNPLPTDNVQYYLHKKGEIFYWPPGPSFVIRYIETDEYLDIQHIGQVDSGVDVLNGIGNINMTFELIDDAAGVRSPKANARSSAVYTLDGQKRTESVDALPKGIYVTEGKKILKRQ